jgi:hypothetical protein
MKKRKMGKDGGRDKEKMKIKQIANKPITNTQIYKYTNIPINGSRSAVHGIRLKTKEKNDKNGNSGSERIYGA